MKIGKDEDFDGSLTKSYKTCLTLPDHVTPPSPKVIKLV